jgi:hypothetical protein
VPPSSNPDSEFPISNSATSTPAADHSEEPPAFEAPEEQKKPNKVPRLLTLIAPLLFISVVAGIALMHPSLKKSSPKPPPKAPVAPAAALQCPVDSGPVPAAEVAWERLDLSSMPADVDTALKLGKYFYDRRLPGNLGLAIGYWKQALARLPAAGQSEVQSLLTSAECELARQFHSDSGDVVVFIKQGRRDQAVALLEAMRADFLNITDPQYVWASVMLSRYRK